MPTSDFSAGQFHDLDTDFQPIFARCQEATMTSVERLYALYKSVEYVVGSGVFGDIVECGVWKGGSMMCAALSLIRMQDTSRCLFLYDTFQGMTRPEAIDIDAQGAAATDMFMPDWGAVALDTVVANMHSTGYPHDRIRCIKGDVKETIPAIVPDKVAILRLDTDWYASTRHELVELFPRLATGGVLIIDDYGHWQGARRAVDEYFGQGRARILLNRIDSTGRIGVKVTL
jgi:O-methyltransferase